MTSKIPYQVSQVFVDGRADAATYIMGKYFRTLKYCSRAYVNVIEAFNVGKSAASFFHTIARLNLKALFDQLLLRTDDCLKASHM